MFPVGSLPLQRAGGRPGVPRRRRRSSSKAIPSRPVTCHRPRR